MARYRLFVLGLVLLLAAGSRAFLLDGAMTDVSTDEVWSVWQTLGTPTQIIQWTPYDWPPGYYLTLGAWRVLVGINPIALRWLSLLAFVIGAAVIYRVARRLRGDGVIAALVYAALGYVTFMSTEMRGYALLFALFPLAIWLALRYFDHPGWRRSLPLALTLTAMLYVSFTSLAAWGALILFTLIVYRRSIWRWWLPGGLTVILMLPLIIEKASLVVARTQATATILLEPPITALGEIYSAWSGSLFPLWIALFALAVVLLIVRERRRGLALGLLVWALLPIALYVTNGLLGFFSPRYAWWVTPGIVLLFGVGLRLLPNVGRAAVAIVFATLALVPTVSHSQANLTSMGTAFDWLTQHAETGDVVLIDPNCGCGDPEVFDYYTQVYFPNGGLTYVTQSGEDRRVWYVTGAARPTPAVHDAVTAGRVAGIFVGPPTRLFRLYEAPPNAAGIGYANGMRFQGFERLDSTDPPIYHEGDPVDVRLWWTADQAPKLDYSVGLYVLDDAGNLIAQENAPPQVADAPQATSQWQPGQFYIEQRTVQLPYPLARGTYHLMMAIYWFGDNQRIAAPGVDQNRLLPLFDFTVVAWGH